MTQKRDLHPRNECSVLLEKHREAIEQRKKENGGNYLETIIQSQKDFQQQLYGLRVFETHDMKKRAQYVDANARELDRELNELVDSLPFKSWKDYTKQQERWALFRDEYTSEEWLEIQYEWVDALHFLLNIGCMLEIDAEKAFALYISKNQENRDRQQRRY